MANVFNENKGFESINRDLIFDNSLSDRARFVYIYMSAKPEDWDFYVSYMCKELGYSKDTLRKYIKELIESGWLTKESQQKKENGTFGPVRYVIKRNAESHGDVNFTVREKFRDGKNATQRNIDNKENRDFIRDKDIYLYRESEKNKDIPVAAEPTYEPPKSKYAGIGSEFLNSPSMLTAFCKNNHVTYEQCEKVVDEIVTEWEFTQPVHNTPTEAKQQLLRTLETKIRIKREYGRLDGDAPALDRFAEECKALKEEGFNKEEIARFYKFYTQKAQDGSDKCLFETYKAWDTRTRFKMFVNPKRHG